MFRLIEINNFLYFLNFKVAKNRISFPGLAKSQSRGELKSPTAGGDAAAKSLEVKKSETDLHWEELLKSTTKALVLCDLDFSDLHSDEDRDILAPAHVANGVPPPPPPCGVPPPMGNPPPMSMGGPPPVPKLLGQNSTINKTKKTVKLFWKVREYHVSHNVMSM